MWWSFLLCILALKYVYTYFYWDTLGWTDNRWNSCLAPGLPGDSTVDADRSAEWVSLLAVSLERTSVYISLGVKVGTRKPVVRSLSSFHVFFFVFKIFYCVSQNHIQSTYTYTYSLPPQVSGNTNLIFAQFICNTVQRQVSRNQQIITFTYIMFISTNHSMCTLCHITDTDDHRLSYSSDYFIRNCSYLFWEIYIASKTSILFFNICKNFKKNILSPFLFVW